jgi:ferric-dicitrate binding protein FerR (iron transport regulator)
MTDEELQQMLDALGRSRATEREFVKQVERLVTAEASAERFVSAVERKLDAAPPPPRRARRLAAPLALAAAAALIVLAVRGSRPVPPAGPPAMATIVAGSLQEQGRRLHAGQVAPAEALLASEEGRSCLRLHDGSQICLEQGSRVRLPGEGRVWLEAGKVAAVVSHQQPGSTFTIHTAVADTVAIGTAFSVELADEGAAAVTRVVQGTVAVAPPGRPRSQGIPVRAHQALAATTGQGWRMSSEEEREEWSLVRAHAVPALLALQAAEPPPPEPTGADGGAPEGEVAVLLRLADALRARGRLRDAQGICDGLERRYPGHPEIERIATELRRPPPAQPWNATPAVYRINAGGGRYVDPRGNVWSADQHYSGGQSGEFLEEIDGTDMDPLYQSERVVFPGRPLTYNLPVPDGTYVVRLHFAEIWAGTVKRNMRKFDVVVEGEKVLAGFDIAGEVGPMTATVQQVITTVRDGSLDIEFRHVLENPKVSAIEVLALTPEAPPPPAPAPPTVFPPLPLPTTDALYRVNTGGREYIDPQGRRWETDNYFNDTGTGAAEYVDIAGTDLDPLYQTERRSSSLPRNRPVAYSFPVPPGRYLVRLHFAELNLEAGVGDNVFDVLLEKSEVLRRVDIFAEVGHLRALVKEAEITVNDGALDLSFRGLVGRPRISAIEVVPLGAGAPGAGCAVGGRGSAAPALGLLLAAIAALARSGRRRRRPA